MTDLDPIVDSGIVIMDRPQGWTSHDVVGKLCRIFRIRKVGHSDTLDSMATGVLVPGIGRGTYFLSRVHADTKSYRATIRFGAAVSIDDAEDELLSESSVASVTDEMIREKITDFTGTIMQKPAAVSAVKIDGVRAYERIRRGEKAGTPARPATITRYEVLDIRHDSDTSHLGGYIDTDVEVDCFAGTLICASARGLGDALGVGGHLTTLRRTAAGVFTIDEALATDRLTAKAEQSDTVNPEIAEVRRPIPDRAASLLPMSLDEARLRCFDTRETTERQAADLAQGKWLKPIGKPGVYAAVSPTGKAPAPLTESGKRAKTVFVVCLVTL